MRYFRRGATVLWAVSFLLFTAPNAVAQEGPGLRAGVQAGPERVSRPQQASRRECREATAACALRAGSSSSVWMLATATRADLTPQMAYSLEGAPAVQSQVRDRTGIPWIVAAGALIVGGALVDGDAGKLLMVGGVVSSAYGLFIYF